MKKKFNSISNWHIEQLERRCRATIQDFEREGETFAAGRGMTYVYKDRGSDILAVAHRDTVQHVRSFAHDGMTVFAPQLDDRLGCHVILDLLIDLDYDILLTEGEESGQSTAQHFQTEKKYKWMFEFDRTGNDCVMYQFDTPYLRTCLNRVGIEPGNGSFSDIAYLGHLGCSGINMGVGYYNYHSTDAYVRLDHMMEQVGLFRRFYNEYKNTYFHFLHQCKTCGTTKNVGKTGYCDQHGFSRVGTHGSREMWDEDYGYWNASTNSTSWKHQNESYWRSRWDEETKQLKTPWTDFNWIPKLDADATQQLLLPSSTTPKEDDEGYEWSGI
jgi:hypothetical protein